MHKVLSWIVFVRESLLTPKSIFSMKRFTSVINKAIHVFLLAAMVCFSPFTGYAFDTGGVYDFRSITGDGNNPDYPSRGTTDSLLIRIASQAYGDGIDLPRGVPVEDEGDGDVEGEEQTLVSAREISNAVHDQGETSIPSTTKLNQLFFQFGQFLSHDTGLSEPDGSFPTGGATGNVGNESFNVEVSALDPDFAFSEIPLTRSAARAAGSSPTNVREQINTITAFIDGSNVYGSTKERCDALRSFHGGLLKVQYGPDGVLPPNNTFGLGNANALRLPEEDLFAAGDVRANEQVGLTGMHTLFIREHNRLAVEIAAHEYPYADLYDSGVDEEIFLKARSIVGALLQKIAFHEWLPALIGKYALDDYYGYNASVDPQISNEFSTAAFRIGHTMLPAGYTPIDAYGNKTVLELGDAFFNPDYVRDNGVEGVLRGQIKTLQQEIDRFIVDGVRNFLFGPGFGGLDLAALNIQRGRDHGIGSYNSVRSAYGLDPVADYDGIGCDSETVDALRSVYGADNMEDLDLWTGSLAEPHRIGTNLGETFTAIFIDQFTRLRDGDRFYFENPDVYSQEFIDNIWSTSFADIIRRNTAIHGNEVNDHAFYIPRFHPFQPDLTIGPKRGLRTHKGENRYNDTAGGQKIRIFKGVHENAAMHFSLGNDGPHRSDISASTSYLSRRDFVSKYYEERAGGRKNITGALRTGRYKQNLDPNERRRLLSTLKLRKHTYGSVRALVKVYAENYYDSLARDLVAAKLRFRHH